MSDALVQAMMLSQRQRANPLDRKRMFGEEILKQGSSTAPVYSPLEGLARALQGGVGGYFAGEAEREQKDKSRRGVEALSAAMAAKSPEERALAIKGLDPDNEYTAPMLGQMLTQQVADERAQARLTQGVGQLGAGYGMPPQGAPQGQPSMSPPMQAGGVNPNNIGNVRPVGGGPNSGFQQPASFDDGVRLAVNNVRAYPGKFNNGQPMTLMQIGQRWAPAGDGANNPNQWALNVANIGGLDPNQPLDLNNPQTAAAFARGVHGAEHGQKNIRPPEVYSTILAGGPQAAQGSADGSGTPLPPQGAQAPQVPNVQRPQPTPQQIAKHQQILQQGGYGQGPEAVAKARAAIEQELDRDWQVQREQGRMSFDQQNAAAKTADQRSYEAQEYERRKALENTEHDRREVTKQPTEMQALSSSFADRMTNSAGIINQFASEGTNKGARMLDSKIFGVGVPFANSMQSEGYQRYRQARDDFINSQLRRESGAVISDSEYENADRQYFPQPGDTPAVMKQKELNRQIAVDGMVRNAGPAYKPSVNVPQQQPQQGTPQAGAVIDGYRFKGGDPSQQGNWEPVQ